MDHNLFKPKAFEEGRHAVVGDCNGFTMQQRWDAETPEFAKAIRAQINTRNSGGYALVLDYGCGVGRLAKAVMSREDKISVKGIDASPDMMKEAEKYCGDPYMFQAWTLAHLNDFSDKFDVAYCVYVLQHVPAIEIRDILQRIYDNLKDDGTFVYCSSDYRMAINFNGSGFWDDRAINGVNLQEEIERYFVKQGPLFSQETLKGNHILNTMITGNASGLPHPAFIYKKKKLKGALYNTIPAEQEDRHPPSLAPEVRTYETKDDGQKIVHDKKEFTKLILINRLAPGDILVMTNALRDLHLAFPGKYQTEVRSPCNAIFENNPYFTKLDYDEGEYTRGEQELHKGDKNGSSFVIKGDILCIDMHYPMIHTSGEAGWHFGYGHRDFLESVLRVKIPQTSIRPEIYLSQAEHDWISPVIQSTGYDGPYWAINAGSKGDYTLKQYPYYQEVVDLLKGKVQFVQIGVQGHNHIPLKGVINMVGETRSERKLFRLINQSLGVLSCVSFPMHIAAAFNKPCVVVAGGREGTRWELYPNQQFLYVNGCLPCAPYDGCWKSKLEDCTNKFKVSPEDEKETPRCMTMIKPQDIVRSIERYYEGGILSY